MAYKSRELDRPIFGTPLSVRGVAGNDTNPLADIVAASDGQVLRRSGTSVGFGAVSLATAAAITGVLPTANGGTSVDIASAALPLGSGQVSFPAAQSASAGANVLDDYEEGTWTPTFIGSTSGAATYSSQAGTYVKIGQLVIATFNVVSLALNTLVGNLQIGGLPFLVNAASSGNAAAMYWSTLGAGTYVSMLALPSASNSVALVFGATAATATVSAVPVAAIGVGTNLAGTLIYRATA